MTADDVYDKLLGEILDIKTDLMRKADADALPELDQSGLVNRVTALEMISKNFQSLLKGRSAPSTQFQSTGGSLSVETIFADSGTIGGFNITEQGIFGSFLGATYQVAIDSVKKRVAIQDAAGIPVSVLGSLNGLQKPGGGTYGAADFGVWANVGAIANWMISQNEIASGPPGTARLSMDSSKLRFRVIDSADLEKVAMGYLGGLPVQGSPWTSDKIYAAGDYANDGAHVFKSLVDANVGNAPVYPGPTAFWEVSTDTWTNSNYGFWARLGDRLTVDGTLDFQGGDQLINNDASFRVMNGDTTIARLGTLNGTKGLFLSEDNIDIGDPLLGVGFQVILTANQLLVGDPSNQYLRWFEGRLTIAGEVQSSNFVPGSAGWRLSFDGTVEFYGALKVSSIQSASLLVYTGEFADLIAGGVVFGRALPTGGHVYYFETSLLNESGANAFAVDVGAAVYDVPSKYGDTSLAPSASFLAHRALPFITTATAEGWVLADGVASQVLFRIYDPFTTMFLALNLNTATSSGAYFPTSYFASGQGYDGVDVRTNIYWNINGVVYDGIDAISGWVFFAISTSGFFIGNGANTAYQALAVPGNSNTLAYLIGIDGVQFSNLMLSDGHSDSQADMEASFASAQPYGQVVSSEIIAFQSDGGVKIPQLTVDPPVVNGTMYYNSTNKVMRFCEDGVWCDVPILPLRPLSGTVSSNTTYTLPNTVGVRTLHIPAAYLVASSGGPYTLTITTGSGGTVRIPISAVGTSAPVDDLSVDVFVDASGNVILKKMPQPFNLGTVVTTSGTSQELIGIPTWAKRVTVTINGISGNGTSLPIFQLGTSAGYVIAGYLGSGATVAGGVAVALVTTGLPVSGNNTAVMVRHGVFTLMKTADDTWVWSGTTGYSNVAETSYAGGQISLPGSLDRIRITTIGGVDTFDAGSFTVLVE